MHASNEDFSGNDFGNHDKYVKLSIDDFGGSYTKAFLEPCQISMMKFFVKIVKRLSTLSWNSA